MSATAGSIVSISAPMTSGAARRGSTKLAARTQRNLQREQGKGSRVMEWTSNRRKEEMRCQHAAGNWMMVHAREQMRNGEEKASGGW